MTFTYTSDLTNSRDYVRFHTGDTESTEAFLTDEIITSLVATSASNNAAVIAAIRYIILKLSKPNFRADWLQVDNKSAREGYQQMLSEKKREFGLLYVDAVHTPVHRMDEPEDDTDALLTYEDDDLP